MVMATRDHKSSSRCRNDDADAGHGLIKCSLGNLGWSRDLVQEKERTIDDCQEDQDVVLGLCGDLIYK